MKKSLGLLGAALGLSLLITGCETDASSRIQEKSTAYATLKPWQKRYVDTGVIAMGFTPDMVYMAIGNPSVKKTTETGELWIFKSYYPSIAADQNKRALNSDTSMDHTTKNGVQMEADGKPTFSTRNQQSISTTGGPQGGSIEPADLQSYTLYVTFQKGVVAQMKLDLN